MDDTERRGWTRRIQEHNELNGVVFSTVEFVLLAVAGAFIAYAYAAHHRPVGVALGVGVALNASVIVSFGIAALAKGERGSHLSTMFNSAYRAEVYRTRPRLARDTMKLIVAVISPFYLLGATLAERPR
jgi:hypothetical protein